VIRNIIRDLIDNEIENIERNNLINKKTVYNTQYKTVGVQWFTGLSFPRQRFPRWIVTNSANPTVSYRKTLAAVRPAKVYN
jgi:hypothetical protein